MSIGLLSSAATATPLDALQADRLRIVEHLSLVEAQLRRAPVENLTPAARGQRARLLDELHQYWQAGVFPRNSAHPFERRPYFIDDDDRACAVAALIERSGHDRLARRIDREFHTEYVRDMRDAELLAWAGEHGFSVAELALIQPTYCACEGAGGAGGADGSAYFEPVCGANGLTYWNQCVAELCGGVRVVATGECAHDAPCELCGTGSSYVVVSECGMSGVCGVNDVPDIVPVGQRVATRWLELQSRNCEDPSYDLEGYDEHDGWQPARPVQMVWECYEPAPTTGGQASGGEAAAGEPGGGTASGGQSSGGIGGAPDTEPEPAQRVSPTGGCTTSASATRNSSRLAMGLVLLLLLRRRTIRR